MSAWAERNAAGGNALDRLHDRGYGLPGPTGAASPVSTGIPVATPTTPTTPTTPPPMPELPFGEPEAPEGDAFLGGVFRAMQRGWENAWVLPDILTGNVEGIVQYHERMKEIQPYAEEQVGLQEIADADSFWEATAAVLTNPDVVLNTIIESLVQFAPALALTAGTTVGGAAAGTAATANPLGAIAGGTLGAMSGAALGSFGIEYLNAIKEFMGDNDVDLGNVEEVRAAFVDEDFMTAAREFGKKRGIPIAVFDAMSMGLAGKFIGASRMASRTLGGAGKASKTAIGAEIGTQMLGGGAGEYMAQWNTGQETQWGDVVMEAAAELGIGTVEVTIGAVLDRSARGTVPGTEDDSGPGKTPNVKGDAKTGIAAETAALAGSLSEKDDNFGASKNVPDISGAGAGAIPTEAGAAPVKTSEIPPTEAGAGAAPAGAAPVKTSGIPPTEENARPFTIGGWGAYPEDIGKQEQEVVDKIEREQAEIAIIEEVLAKGSLTPEGQAQLDAWPKRQKALAKQRADAKKDDEWGLPSGQTTAERRAEGKAPLLTELKSPRTETEGVSGTKKAPPSIPSSIAKDLNTGVIIAGEVVNGKAGDGKGKGKAWEQANALSTLATQIRDTALILTGRPSQSGIAADAIPPINDGQHVAEGEALLQGLAQLEEDVTAKKSQTSKFAGFSSWETLDEKTNKKGKVYSQTLGKQALEGLTALATQISETKAGKSQVAPRRTGIVALTEANAGAMTNGELATQMDRLRADRNDAVRREQEDVIALTQSNFEVLRDEEKLRAKMVKTNPDVFKKDYVRLAGIPEGPEPLVIGKPAAKGSTVTVAGATAAVPEYGIPTPGEKQKDKANEQKLAEAAAKGQATAAATIAASEKPAPAKPEPEQTVKLKKITSKNSIQPELGGDTNTFTSLISTLTNAQLTTLVESANKRITKLEDKFFTGLTTTKKAYEEAQKAAAQARQAYDEVKENWEEVLAIDTTRNEDDSPNPAVQAYLAKVIRGVEKKRDAVEKKRDAIEAIPKAARSKGETKALKGETKALTKLGKQIADLNKMSGEGLVKGHRRQASKDLEKLIDKIELFDGKAARRKTSFEQQQKLANVKKAAGTITTEGMKGSEVGTQAARDRTELEKKRDDKEREDAGKKPTKDKPVNHLVMPKDVSGARQQTDFLTGRLGFLSEEIDARSKRQAGVRKAEDTDANRRTEQAILDRLLRQAGSHIVRHAETRLRLAPAQVLAVDAILEAATGQSGKGGTRQSRDMKQSPVVGLEAVANAFDMNQLISMGNTLGVTPPRALQTLATARDRGQSTKKPRQAFDLKNMGRGPVGMATVLVERVLKFHEEGIHGALPEVLVRFEGPLAKKKKKESMLFDPLEGTDIHDSIWKKIPGIGVHTPTAYDRSDWAKYEPVMRDEGTGRLIKETTTAEHTARQKEFRRLDDMLKTVEERALRHQVELAELTKEKMQRADTRQMEKDFEREHGSETRDEFAAEQEARLEKGRKVLGKAVKTGDWNPTAYGVVSEEAGFNDRQATYFQQLIEDGTGYKEALEEATNLQALDDQRRLEEKRERAATIRKEEEEAEASRKRRTQDKTVTVGGGTGKQRKSRKVMAKAQAKAKAKQDKDNKAKSKLDAAKDTANKKGRGGSIEPPGKMPAVDEEAERETEAMRRDATAAMEAEAEASIREDMAAEVETLREITYIDKRGAAQRIEANRLAFDHYRTEAGRDLYLEENEATGRTTLWADSLASKGKGGNARRVRLGAPTGFSIISLTVTEDSDKTTQVKTTARARRTKKKAAKKPPKGEEKTPGVKSEEEIAAAAELAEVRENNQFSDEEHRISRRLEKEFSTREFTGKNDELTAVLGIVLSGGLLTKIGTTMENSDQKYLAAIKSRAEALGRPDLVQILERRIEMQFAINSALRKLNEAQHARIVKAREEKTPGVVEPTEARAAPDVEVKPPKLGDKVSPKVDDPASLQVTQPMPIVGGGAQTVFEAMLGGQGETKKPMAAIAKSVPGGKQALYWLNALHIGFSSSEFLADKTDPTRLNKTAVRVRRPELIYFEAYAQLVWGASLENYPKRMEQLMGYLDSINTQEGVNISPEALKGIHDGVQALYNFIAPQVQGGEITITNTSISAEAAASIQEEFEELVHNDEASVELASIAEIKARFGEDEARQRLLDEEYAREPDLTVETDEFGTGYTYDEASDTVIDDDVGISGDLSLGVNEPTDASDLTGYDLKGKKRKLRSYADIGLNARNTMRKLLKALQMKEKGEVTLNHLVKMLDDIHGDSKTFFTYLNRALKGKFDDVKVVLDDTYKLGKDIGPSSYNEQTNTITLRLNHPMMRSPGSAIEAITHEMVHSTSLAELKTNKEFRQAMQKLMNRIQAAEPTIVEEYGFTDVTEFVAEAFSNAEFQRKLADIDIQYKTPNGNFVANALMRMLNVIAKYIGLKSIPEHSALYAVMDVGLPALRMGAGARPVGHMVAFPLSKQELVTRAQFRAALEQERADLWDADLDGTYAARDAGVSEGEEFWLESDPSFIREGWDRGMEGLDWVQSKVSSMTSKGGFKYILTTTDNLFRRAMDVFGTDFGEGATNPVKMVQRYREMGVTEASKVHHRVRKFGTKFENLSKARQRVFQQLMHDTTMANMFPQEGTELDARSTGKRTGKNAHIEPTRENLTRWDELNARYMAMEESERELFDEMANFSEQILKELKAALMIRASHAFGLQEAAESNTDYKPLLDKFLKAKGRKEINDVVKELEVLSDSLEDPAMTKDDLDSLKKGSKALIEKSEIEGPYFPLRRYGDYVVSGTRDDSVTYETVEEANRAAKEFSDEARKNKATVSGTTVSFEGEYFELVETPRVGKKRSEELAAKGWDMDPVSNKLDAERKNYGGDVAELAGMLTRDLYKEDDASSEALRNHLEVMVMEMLAFNSAASSQLRREGVAGVNPAQMFRSFAEYGWASGWQIADATTSHMVNKGYRQMKALAVGAKAVGLEKVRPSDETIVKRGKIINEMMRREAQGLKERRSVTAQLLGRFGFGYFLATPAYAMQNATQVWALGMPHLASRHGTGKSATAIWKSYTRLNKVWAGAIADVVKAYDVQGGFADGKIMTEEHVFDTVMKHLKENHPDDHAIVTALMELNIIEATFMQELMDTITGKRETPLGTGIEGAFEIARLLPASVEILNRMVMGMAAYELSNDTIVFTPEGQVDHLKSNYDETATAVRATQLDYRQSNKPPLFRHPVGRIMFMFKMYSLGVYDMIGRSIGAVLKNNQSDLTRKQGAKQFAWIMGTHSLMAGISGGVLMEPVRALLWGISAAFDLNEEDEEWESMMRESMISIGMSPVTIDMLMYGPIGGAMGVNMSDKLGIGHLTLGRLQFNKYSSATEQLWTKIGGPMVGVAKGTERGWESFAEGNFAKGLSQGAIPIFPAFIRDVTRSYDLANRGIVTRGGAVPLVPEKVSAWNALTQGVGWQPMKVKTTYEGMNSVRNIEAYWKDRGQKIRKRIVNGIVEGDHQAVRAAFKDMNLFNRQSISTVKIRGPGLTTAMREVHRRRALTRNGIYTKTPELMNKWRMYDQSDWWED